MRRRTAALSLSDWARIPSRKTKGVLILTAAAVSAILLGTRALSRYESIKAQDQWMNAGSPVAGPSGAGPLLSPAASHVPGSHKSHYLRAAAFESEASRGGFFEYARRRTMLEAAETEVLHAIRDNPMSASYWAALGRIAGQQQKSAASDQAFEQALMLARTNGFIHRDYGVSLVLRGRIQEGASQFVIARNYAAGISLRQLLELLGTRTSDTVVWQSIVRYQPDDLKIYSDFLRSRGLTDIGDRIWKEAEALEKK